MKNYFDTPILIVAFNKVNATRLVIDAIKTIRPRQLFIAADGPRIDVPGDAEKCARVRGLFEDVDWDCKVSTLFQEQNLGCKKGVSTAISWFFKSVDHGIILEDDCLPDLSFFRFCKTLLSHYRNDSRIMMISGNNWLDGRKIGAGSYFFSKYAFIWGWATWKRAWEKFDVGMSTYEYFKDNDLINNIFDQDKICKFWIDTFDKVYSGELDSWATIWNYTLFINNGLGIIPNTNLVSNIGFGLEESSHTKDENSRLAGLKTMAINKIVHPMHIFPDREYDLTSFEKVFEVVPPKITLRKRIRRRWKNVKRIYKTIN